MCVSVIVKCIILPPPPPPPPHNLPHSKFSPWLSLGCISPRWCYWEVVRWERGDNWYTSALQERQGVGGGRGGGGVGGGWKYDEWSSAPPPGKAGGWGSREDGFGEGKGSYWMVFEFESRDFMHYMARKHGVCVSLVWSELGIDTVCMPTYKFFKTAMTNDMVGLLLQKSPIYSALLHKHSIKERYFAI